MFRAHDALTGHDARRWSALGSGLFVLALAGRTRMHAPASYIARTNGNAGRRPRALSRIGWLPARLWGAARSGARRFVCGKAVPKVNRATVQFRTRSRRWWARGNRRRLGLRTMDGESAFLPANRRPGGILLAWTWKDAALFHRRDHRSDVRPAFSTRRSRIRIESGLGSGLRHLLVVSRAADPQATLAWARAGLVTLARTRTVRLAHGSYRLWPDCRRDLRRFRQTLGRLLHR